MAFQAFIDESAKYADGNVVMAGGIAEVSAWAAFSKDWEELLPRFGRIDKKKGRIFHMAETRDMDIVRLFYRIMERHVPIFLSARLNLSELRSAQRRVYIVGGSIDWDGWNNPYFVLFRCLMDKFHVSRKLISEIIPLSETVDFIFADNDIYKNPVREAWDDYLRNRATNVRDFYGVEPKFERPEIFLPLQGADLWAWWVRHWCDEGAPEKIGSADFGTFKRSDKQRAVVDISFNEDQLIDSFAKLAKTHAGHRQVLILPKL